RKARLYQDGLPACGLEEKIVRDLAMQGVPNYRILLKLMERGATLEGTEDPDLLRTEYELIMSTAAGATDAGWHEGGLAARARGGSGTCWIKGTVSSGGGSMRPWRWGTSAFCFLAPCIARCKSCQAAFRSYRSRKCFAAKRLWKTLAPAKMPTP